MTTPAKIVVLMGIAGSGKTTIGRELASALECPFIEGDDFHSDAARKKMSRGTPLNDEDRWPWLDRIAQEISRQAKSGDSVVVACSALKQSYRQHLSNKLGCPITLVHLAVNHAEAERRMKRRKDHFMNLELLESQFDALEPPERDENALTIDAKTPVPETVTQIVNFLGY